MGQVWAGKLTGRGDWGSETAFAHRGRDLNPKALAQLLLPGAASGTRTRQPRYGELRSLSLILHASVASNWDRICFAMTPSDFQHAITFPSIRLDRGSCLPPCAAVEKYFNELCTLRVGRWSAPCFVIRGSGRAMPHVSEVSCLPPPNRRKGGSVSEARKKGGTSRGLQGQPARVTHSLQIRLSGHVFPLP